MEEDKKKEFIKKSQELLGVFRKGIESSKRKLKLEELDKLMNVEGFFRHRDYWFASNVDLGKVIEGLGDRVDFDEMRLVSAYEYLNDKEFEKIFYEKHLCGKKYPLLNPCLIYVRKRVLRKT